MPKWCLPRRCGQTLLRRIWQKRWRNLQGGGGAMAGAEMQRPYKTRHPELVSGSISRRAPVLRVESDLAAKPRHTPCSSRAARWTLKQVQGDGFGEVGLR